MRTKTQKLSFTVSIATWLLPVYERSPDLLNVVYFCLFVCLRHLTSVGEDIMFSAAFVRSSVRSFVQSDIVTTISTERLEQF